MQKTLLEIVQSTLGSMDSDTVESIGDTVESEQVAITAQEQFLELATYQFVSQFMELTQLIGLSDNEKATVMRIPDGSTDIKDVRYKRTDVNGTSQMREVPFVPKEEFLNRVLSLKVGEDNVGENVLEDNIRLPYRNDKHPECWTTFDDEHLVFDSVDTVVQKDVTLHNDNSLVMAYIIPEFELRDSYVPPVPIKLFPQYMNMIKEINSYEQRQISNEPRTRKAERQGHRNRHFGGIHDGADSSESTTIRSGMGRFARRSSGNNGTKRFG